MLRRKKKPTYPDFLIIGAQKAGTTWLYYNLLRHPQVWMPKVKELHYFDEKVRYRSSIFAKLWGKRFEDRRWRSQLELRMRNYRNYPNRRVFGEVLWDLKYFLKSPNDKWYASLFEQGRRKISGEITPDYSTLGRDAIAHVHEVMPEARIIFMMRNPMERAWSQAMMEFGRGEPVEDIPFPKLNRHFVNARSRRLSNYMRTLDTWRMFYPEEQIFVGFLEDINFHPNRLMHRLYEFLGADTSIEYRVMERKIHARAVDLIPKRSAIRLARIYRKQIQRLDESFGGYASFWHFCARRLDEDPPKQKTIPYPLTESFLWDEWVSSIGESAPGEDGVRSGPLSSMLVES